MKIKYTGKAKWPCPSDGGKINGITVIVGKVYEFTKDYVEKKRLLVSGFEEVKPKKKKTESEEVL